ncbi:GNAT family N-acetyltransferase [Streptomyces sp. ID05-26A]|nr:GNAT family N-acetyltransferase [Streptomyces sp. ID05-26A]
MTVILSVPSSGAAPALELRPWQPDDVPALLAAHRDPLLRRWLATSLADEADARRWLDAQATGWADATRFSFAVITDGAPVGHVVVKAGPDGTSEVGYWTAAQARGRGIAVSAVNTVSQWAFDVHALTRLALLHAAGNEASCRVAIRCGYVLEDALPAAPPAFPAEGHRHVRTASDQPRAVPSVVSKLDRFPS